MSILDYFRSPKTASASVAKERLQIIIAHQRSRESAPDYLPRMQKEIMNVIAKYVDIDPDQINFSLDRDGNNAVLELNVTLPEAEEEAA